MKTYFKDIDKIILCRFTNIPSPFTELTMLRVESKVVVEDPQYSANAWQLIGAYADMHRATVNAGGDTDGDGRGVVESVVVR